MKNRILIAAALLFAAGAASVHSLEVKEGRIKLVVDESTARFYVYYMTDISKGTYVPLLFDQDPRTTFPTISIDQRTYRLGESSDFRFTVSAEGIGVKIVYRSSWCVVTQTFSFVKSPGAAVSDGVILSFTIENVSEKDMSVGLRMLFDTANAEKSGTHFTTDLRSKVPSELYLTKPFDDSWLATPGDAGASFQCMLKGSGITQPDGVLFSNWKRLNDASWLFEASAGRAFSLLPYSINDSAVALFWNPAIVGKGQTRKIVTAFGQTAAKGFAATGDGRSATEDIFGDTVLSEESSLEDLITAVQTDLIAIRDLLAQIEYKIQNGIPLTEEELRIWLEILKKLEERKEYYE